MYEYETYLKLNKALSVPELRCALSLSFVIVFFVILISFFVKKKELLQEKEVYKKELLSNKMKG